MAHIKISTKTDASAKGYSLLVDGVEMVQHVLAEGFGINFDGDHPVVTMRLAIAADDGLDIDLPDAVVEALRAKDVS